MAENQWKGWMFQKNLVRENRNIPPQMTLPSCALKEWTKDTQVAQSPGTSIN